MDEKNSYIYSLILLKSVYELDTTNNFFNSKWHLNSFASIASHLWNTLPSNARIAGNVNTFRSIIDKFNLVPFIYR